MSVAMLKKTKVIPAAGSRLTKRKTQKSESEQDLPNGTGSENSPEVDSVPANLQPIKITKISKVKLSREENTIDTPVKNSFSLPDQFHGFDIEHLSEEDSERQDAFIRVLGELNISTCLKTIIGPLVHETVSGEEKEVEESSEEEEEEEVITSGEEQNKPEELNKSKPEEKDEISEEIENTPEEIENTPEEDMTVDTTATASDTESEHMEVDTENVKSLPKVDKKDKEIEIVDVITIEETQAKGKKNTSNLKGANVKVEYCGTCSAVVDDAEEGIFCDGGCDRWFHLRCSGLSQAEYDELGRDENAKWACVNCSGKPPRLAPGAKPLLSVRKDLGQVTPTPQKKGRTTNKEGRTPRLDISNPAFLKPFDYGWKRELVYRSTMDSQNRRQGDVYYYTPVGKKLRSLREISEHVAGTDLSIDNFTFWKEPIGVDDSSKEIIREAKLKLGNRDPSSSPVTPVIKKVSTPKIPKTLKVTPKITPKLTATVSPLDASGTPKVSASVTPRVVLKKPSTPLAAKFKATPKATTTPGQAQKIVITKEKKKKSFSDDELEMGMLPPMWDPSPKPKEKSPSTVALKRPLEEPEGSPEAKKAKKEEAPVVVPSPVMTNFVQNMSYAYKALLISFQYLKVQELLRASRVSHMWHDLALHKDLWEVVRMKNSQVKDWEGFAATLRRVGTKHLDLRKMLMPDRPEVVKLMWSDCIKAMSKVTSLVKLDLGRCAPFLLEQIAAACPQLENISAAAIKTNKVPLNLTAIGYCQNLTDLKIKSQGGIELTNVALLSNLSKLKQLSLTSVNNMNAVLEVVGKMPQLESLELGDCVALEESTVTKSLSQLTKLRRLRLEKGQEGCPTEAILTTISKLPSLTQLELINFDVKIGFDNALGHCSNIKTFLIIPTYVTQSATTNHLVIEGVNKLSKTLTYFVWGLTIELLRVTDLFIDQWEMGQKKSAGKGVVQSPGPKKSQGDSIPILKPEKDGNKPTDGAVTQVDVLQLPKLHKVLTTLLPNTKIIILKVPFSATWRQMVPGCPQ